MSVMAGMFSTSRLLNGLLSKDPGMMTLSELDRLQQFVNKGRTAVILKDHPQLETIFGVHAIDGREKVVDILLCFMNEGGLVGSPKFRKMVNGMVSQGLVSPLIIEVLERNNFLQPRELVAVNEDGVSL